MSGTKYLVTVSAVDTDEFVAYAYGDLSVMNFVAKNALKAIGDQPGDFSARIVEVEAVGTEDEKRTVVSVQGDAETVAVVVKKKITKERKEADASGETLPADVPADVDVENV